VGAFFASIPMTSHIIDNLLPNPHLNLFIQLVQLRLVLYFVLGLECLLWYQHALDNIRGSCFPPTRAPGELPSPSGWNVSVPAGTTPTAP
jgi:hypothetical protein